MMGVVVVSGKGEAGDVEVWKRFGGVRGAKGSFDAANIKGQARSKPRGSRKDNFF